MKIFKAWFMSASAQRRERLAKVIGTNVQTLRAMSNDGRVSVERAAAIEVALKRIDPEAGITRAQIHSVCAKCPYAREQRR